MSLTTGRPAADDAAAPIAGRRPVVVGVDAFGHADQAIRWAAELAARDARPLTLVHAWTWPFFQVAIDSLGGDPARAEPEERVRQLLDTARSTALTHRPGLDVAVELPVDSAVAALGARSRTAEIVVVGSDGYGELGALALGSVSIKLTEQSACPLAVVRGTATAGGPVVVGVDDSPSGRAAIHRAVDEAVRSGSALRAVRVSRSSDDVGAHHELRELLGPALSHAPGLTVEHVVAHGRAGPALAAASSGAALVVVGAHGPGGFRALAPGSASHHLIHHAHCPVLVVPRAPMDQP